MFKPIANRKAPQVIINQIRNAILQGKIAPGEKLPSSSELMEKFGVSKATLRVALRALEYMGLIDIRKGAKGGLYVSKVDSKISRDSLVNFFHFQNISVQNLSEVRKILEPHAAKIASQKISPEELEELNEINAKCTTAMEKGQQGKVSMELINFHRVIAQCTENPILIFILTFVEDLLQEAKDQLRPDKQFFQSVIEAHKKIVDALRDGDAERAWEEMYKDVSQVEEHLAAINHDA